MRSGKSKKKTFLVIIAVDVLLIAAVLFLMRYVQYLLDEDVRINLTEIVTQNKDVISSKLSAEMNTLQLEADRLTDTFRVQENITPEEMMTAFYEFAHTKDNKTLTFAYKDGRGINNKGAKFDISGRNYFKLGLEGIQNISDRLISRIDGEDIFVLCVPVYLENEIVGTVQQQYSPKEMYDICSVSLFSQEGSTYIINSQGYILVYSDDSEYNRESDNYYRILYLTDPKASKKLEADIKANRSGFMEATIESENVFFAYTNLEEIHDWYLISSIATTAVSPNGNVVVKLFYTILFTITSLFTVSMLYYSSLKKKQHQDLEKIAFVDSVTGGISFTKFTVDLAKILKNNPNDNFYIITFDINNFKYLNGHYGFEKGDAILREIYDTYQTQLQPKERIARITSDHFVLVLNDISADRLKEMVPLEFYAQDIKIYITAGIYEIEDKNKNINLMIDKARTAAKLAARNHHDKIGFYSKDIDEAIEKQEESKRQVEIALKNGEIIPFFQPKVNVNTKELVGAEALARWIRSDGKMIPPCDFIPVCEEVGLITKVDMAIFEQTLQFISKNLKEGISCTPISVNFSRLHLEDKNFFEVLLGKIEQYQVPAELLEVEITETAIFDNYDVINAFIDKLHANGLKISMDDFGTGYSSLHMLKDVQLDVLKIDRGFLSDTTDNIRQTAIFETIVTMAEKLQMKVVVEGVETIENVRLMQENDCLFAQGYYFAKPMSEEFFEKIYKEKSV